MSIIGWIGRGLIAGFVASKIVNKTGEGVILDIVPGVVGAIVGGWLFAAFGAAGATGFRLHGMLVAVVGAVVVLVVYHLVTGRCAGHLSTRPPRPGSGRKIRTGLGSKAGCPPVEAASAGPDRCRTPATGPQ